jgi:hypothetical protein
LRRKVEQRIKGFRIYSLSKKIKNSDLKLLDVIQQLEGMLMALLSVVKEWNMLLLNSILKQPVNVVKEGVTAEDVSFKPGKWHKKKE